MTNFDADVPSTPAPVEALRASLNEVLVEAQALRVDVHGAEAARRRANTINLGVLGLLVVFVALLIAVGWQGNTAIHESRQANERIADCTTPGGECYEQGRVRTDGAIRVLTTMSIYVSQCGRLFPGEAGPEYDRKLEQCVAQKISVALGTSGAPSPSPSATR